MKILPKINDIKKVQAISRLVNHADFTYLLGYLMEANDEINKKLRTMMDDKFFREQGAGLAVDDLIEIFTHAHEWAEKMFLTQSQGGN